MHLRKCYPFVNVFLPSRVNIFIQLGVVNSTPGSEVQYRLSENQYVIRRNICYSLSTFHKPKDALYYLRSYFVI
jgi:hypothetical protein